MEVCTVPSGGNLKFLAAVMKVVGKLVAMMKVVDRRAAVMLAEEDKLRTRMKVVSEKTLRKSWEW